MSAVWHLLSWMLYQTAPRPRKKKGRSGKWRVKLSRMWKLSPMKSSSTLCQIPKCYNSYFVRWIGLQRTRRAFPRGSHCAVIKDRSAYILSCLSALTPPPPPSDVEWRQVAKVGDSCRDSRIPTPFFCLRFFFPCIICLAPAQPKSKGPWSNSSYPLHKSHNNNGVKGLFMPGVYS